jgi:large subunit ribosomal protein L33
MRERVRLMSSAGTGYAYYATRNKKTSTEKLRLKKYDPKARKHVEFVEGKMPSHSKK